MPIKTKHIPKVLVDYTEDIERHIANIKKRRDVAKSLSEAGYIDAPYIPYMVSLGPSDGRYEFTRDTTPDNRKSYYTYDYDTGSYRLVGRISSFDAKYDYFEKGTGYTLKEFIGRIQQVESVESDTSIRVGSVSHALLDCGNDGEPELALQVLCEGDLWGEGTDYSFIIKN